MVRTEVVEGDYKGYHINVFNNSIHLCKEWSSEDIVLTKKDIRKIEAAAEDVERKYISRKKYICGAAGSGFTLLAFLSIVSNPQFNLINALLFSGIFGSIFGAIAGFLLWQFMRKVCFLCLLKNGKRFTGVCSKGDFKNIMALK
ncbi:MAG: hypothetical protein PHO02_02345 [Candidatus Nanoarchaeia archaeon]|nr:hypothetical protein [Candidatus Nanoarchaeia archaeon]